MKNFLTRLTGIDLQLFAEEGTSQGTTPSAETKVGENKGDKSSTTPVEPKVVYGIQDEPGNEENDGDSQANSSNNNVNKDDKSTSDTNNNNVVDVKKEWDKIKNDAKYRAIYEEEVQGFIKTRIKDHKQLQEKVANTDTLVQVLANKYGVKDLNELTSLVTKDIYEAEAFEKGIDPEYYAETQQMKIENDRLKTQYKTEEETRAINEKIGKWFAEEKAVKEIYPSFDLKSEASNNEKFLKLIDSGIDIKTAYEVSNPTAIEEHKKMLLKTAEKNVTEKIKARGNRPVEGAVQSTSSSGVVIKSDVHQLTKKDREEINARVRRGEKIKF